MHALWFGALLGMGAAIPIGPVNLEIIRRNLRYGTSYGVVTGLGACGADVTYLVLLCAGALALLQYPEILRYLSGAGSLVLAWFGLNAFRAKIVEPNGQTKNPSLIRYGIEGYIITLINPYTVLFWASVSSQVATFASSQALLLAGAGVILGTVGWVAVLNGSLYVTRHKISPRAMKILNYSGGIILLGFALLGLLRAFNFVRMG